MRNSIKFTKRGSISVSVNYDFQHNKLMIVVTDTGDGMDAKELAQAYDSFGKLNRTADQNSVGLGLGLKIVKKIAEQYHGTVQASSAGKGLGSTFEVKLQIRTVQDTNELESSSFAQVRNAVNASSNESYKDALCS